MGGGCPRLRGGDFLGFGAGTLTLTLSQRERGPEGRGLGGEWGGAEDDSEGFAVDDDGVDVVGV